jgi:transposase
MVKEKPDMYLDEMVVEMKRRTNKEVSISTLWRSLKYCGITHKKVYYYKRNLICSNN